MIAPEAGLSVSRQCALLGVVRSSFYYRPRPESAEELELLKRLDRIFTGHPVYGSRRLQVALLREGVSVGRRRIRRLMRKLGLWAVRPKRNTSKRHPEHKVYPYLGVAPFQWTVCQLAVYVLVMAACMSASEVVGERYPRPECNRTGLYQPSIYRNT